MLFKGYPQFNMNNKVKEDLFKTLFIFPPPIHYISAMQSILLIWQLSVLTLKSGLLGLEHHFICMWEKCSSLVIWAFLVLLFWYWNIYIYIDLLHWSLCYVFQTCLQTNWGIILPQYLYHIITFFNKCITLIVFYQFYCSHWVMVITKWRSLFRPASTSLLPQMEQSFCSVSELPLMHR